MVFTHVIKDIVQVSQKNKAQKQATELREFFSGQLTGASESEVARRAAAILISMYRQNIWKNANAINQMSVGLLHPDVKIAAAMAHLFLGNKTKGLTDILEESEDEEEATEVVKGLLGSKKTANRVKKLKRAKATIKKAQKKRGEKQDTTVSFVAVDMLN